MSKLTVSVKTGQLQSLGAPLALYASSLLTTTRIEYLGPTISGSRSHDLTALRDIPVCLQIFLIDCLPRKYKGLILANVPTLITPVSSA